MSAVSDQLARRVDALEERIESLMVAQVAFVGQMADRAEAIADRLDALDPDCDPGGE